MVGDICHKPFRKKMGGCFVDCDGLWVGDGQLGHFTHTNPTDVDIFLPAAYVVLLCGCECCTLKLMMAHNHLLKFSNYLLIISVFF